MFDSLGGDVGDGVVELIRVSRDTVCSRPLASNVVATCGWLKFSKMKVSVLGHTSPLSSA